VEHAGGLAMFDLLGELTTRHEVDLYSVYRESLDRGSLALLTPKLGAVRLWSSTWMEPDDARAWMEERRLAPGHYDAIHFFWPGSAHLIPAVGRWGKRRVFTLQECTTRSAAIAVERAVSEQPEKAGEAARALVANLLVERGALLGCDHSIALTNGDADFAEHVLGVPRPSVIPTGISEHAVLGPLHAHGPSRDARIVPHTVTFLGYYDHPPNVDAMIWYLERVHPLVKMRLEDYRLAVVGAGDLSPLKSRFGSDPTVDFVGRVDEIAGPLLRAQVCVAPLVSGAGFRGKINQYSAAGRPTVATSLAADGLGYRDEESILIADHHDRFAEQLVRLLTDGALWQRIRAGAEQAIDPFRWPRLIERYEALYR
jgi:glycosyltransferase involved in cell wall biosynthesis